ncbi:MAG TPA: helix-turn-helix domain-containing protein [Chloroflexia bacterium]|nr:helix-turn-helix domain-containing protein [Chloroflexia bacterium]
MAVNANHMRVGDIRALLNRERYEALSVRDPIAIDKASERYTVLDTVLATLPENEVLDLYKPMLSVSQAARLLGYKPKEIRRLLGQGKISGKKMSGEWRIPLKAVL